MHCTLSFRLGVSNSSHPGGQESAMGADQRPNEAHRTPPPPTLVLDPVHKVPTPGSALYAMLAPASPGSMPHLVLSSPHSLLVQAMVPTLGSPQPALHMAPILLVQRKALSVAQSQNMQAQSQNSVMQVPKRALCVLGLTCRASPARVV